MRRILMLNYEFPPLGGGAGNATYYLLRELSKSNEISIDLVTSSLDKFKIENFSSKVRIHKLDIGKSNQVHYQSNKDLLKYSWKSYRYCKKLFKKESFDLIHAFFGIPCGFVAYKLKKPYIISLRGSDVPFYNPRFNILDKFVFQRLSRRIWKDSKAVITNSQGLKELANKTSPDQFIDVIYNGVDINEFRPFNKKNDNFIILSTSRFIKRKGIEYLIEAFCQFQKESLGNVKLLLIGNGDLNNKFQNEVKSQNIGHLVEFRGALLHSEISKTYQEADVFVLPSLNEGMSNCILEAMASGLPIITTDTGGSKELIDTRNGFIVEKRNSTQITAALSKLYSNRELLNSMSRESRSKAEKMSWENMAKKYLEIYQHV